ncbi:cysteine hydrolase [Neorhizobium lilium]|uniref:Cysteine hydrolase n=1 Tax=Neorhizobium lilium TaxID=2503024 RepID=A0A3S3VTT7_9HYPH|nr:cysteine hydrolase family protein [Neorhizobium lilium]RWX81723.1 cysteine hydrolase [Neorhizobium lilium]
MSARFPSATAPLIVIDLQNAMFDGLVEPPLHDADTLTGRVGDVLDWARATGRPVAFIRHDGPEGDAFAPGSPGWPIFPAFAQRDDEPTFGKSVGDAFSNPQLIVWVEKLDAQEVVLVGAQTDFCVAATVNGALSQGLKVTVVSDAHSTVDLPNETASSIILRYNAQFAEAGVNLLKTDELA